jgi:hypothetical protein
MPPALLALLLVLASAVAAGAEAPAPIPLRADPDRMCEASGVVGGRDATAWVVDGAIDDTVFGFTLDAGTLAAAKSRNLDLSTVPAAERPRDLEAAAVVVRSLVLVGAHARNEACEVRPESERILVADVDESGPALRGTRTIDDAAVMARVRGGDEETCLRELFTQLGRANDASRALCRAIVAAERSASKDACGTFAIAGAATVVQEERERLWLGLRTPLVDGKAALVRVATLNGFGFDMTVLVDLGGRSVRALTPARRSMLAIAGPPRDARLPFALFHLTPRGDDTFGERLVRDDLVPSSEGLLATDDGAVVVVDGEAGKDGAGCREAARQYRVIDASLAR